MLPLILLVTVAAVHTISGEELYWPGKKYCGPRRYVVLENFRLTTYLGT